MQINSLPQHLLVVLSFLALTVHAAQANSDQPAPPAPDRGQVLELLQAAADRAAAIEALTGNPTRVRQAELLALTARQLARLDATDQATRRLNQARDFAQQIRQDAALLGQANWAIGQAMIQLGRLDDAIALANATQHRESAARLWGAIAAAQITAGNLDAATTSIENVLQHIDAVDDPNDGTTPPVDVVRTDVAAELINAGHLGQALMFANKCIDPNEKAHALARIAAVLARYDYEVPARKVLQTSIQTTNTINGGQWKWTSPWVAKAQALLGDRDAAEAAARESDLSLAAAMLAVDAARRTAPQLHDEWMDTAIKRYQNLREAFEKSEAYRAQPHEWVWDIHDLTYAQAAGSRPTEMATWIRRWQTPMEQAYALLGAATFYTEQLAPQARPRLIQTSVAVSIPETEEAPRPPRGDRPRRRRPEN